MRVSKQVYLFLQVIPAAGDEPETNTDKTDLNRRRILKDGL